MSPIKKSTDVKTNNAIIQILTVFKEPILSSNFPTIRHPIIPDRLIKTPKNKISDSIIRIEKSNHTCESKNRNNSIIKKK